MPRTGGTFFVVRHWRVYAVGAAFCVAAAVSAYWFGVQPAMARREVFAADTAELHARQQKAQDLSQKLAAARRKLDQTGRDVTALKMKLDAGSAVNQRTAKLAELAGESRLTLEVQPGTAANGANYQTVPVRVTGSGTYPDCAAFLHRLRERFPDMAVKSFEVAAAANNAARGNNAPATFRADLAWYTLPAKK